MFSASNLSHLFTIYHAAGLVSFPSFLWHSLEPSEKTHSATKSPKPRPFSNTQITKKKEL
jgi:hypothetical protein